MSPAIAVASDDSLLSVCRTDPLSRRPRADGGHVITTHRMAGEAFTQGPTATEVGQYELRDNAGKVRDMFSTNVPAPKKIVRPPTPIPAGAIRVPGLLHRAMAVKSGHLAKEGIRWRRIQQLLA
jgi:hypothetical protein